MTRKVLLPSITAAIAAWAAWSYLYFPNQVAESAPQKGITAQPDQTAGTPSSFARGFESALKPAQPLVRPSAKTAPAPKPRSEIALAFEKAKDLKAFYDRVSTLSTPEAKYYAARAMQECLEQRYIPVDNLRRDFAQRIAPTDPSYSLRAAALERLTEDRCGGFAAGFLNDASAKQMIAQAAEQGDIRARMAQLQLAIQQRLTASGEQGPRSTTLTNEELALLREAAQSDDPDIYRRLANWWLLWQRNEGVHAGPNRESVNSLAWSAAWSMLACENGMNCSGDSRFLNMQCASQGFCGAPDLNAYYQQYGLSPYQYQQALNYQLMIRAAILQGQWDWIGLGAPPTVGMTGRRPPAPRR